MERLTEKGRLAFNFIVETGLELLTSVRKEEVAEGTGISARGVGLVLNKLVKDGYIVQLEDGSYVSAKSAQLEKVEEVEQEKGTSMSIAGGTLNINKVGYGKVYVFFYSSTQAFRATIDEEEVAELIYFLERLTEVQFDLTDSCVVELEGLYYAEVEAQEKREEEALLAEMKAHDEAIIAENKKRELIEEFPGVRVKKEGFKKNVYTILYHIKGRLSRFYPKKGKKKYYQWQLVVFYWRTKKAKIRRLLTIQNQGSHLRDFDP